MVDNGSAILPERAEPVSQLILNPHNPGFAVACNQGAAHARAPWLLFLNPDCFPGADDLRHLLELASAQSELGVLGAQLLEADGRPQPASRRLDPTPVRLLQALRRGRTAIETPTETGTKSEPIELADAVSGALMLIPRAAFDAVQGFDEGYRLHFEDLDLCRRLRAGGWKVALAPQVRITHLKGTSSRRRPLWVALQKHRGLRRYFERFDAESLPVLRRQLFRLLLWCALPLMLLTALRPSAVHPNEASP